jgi:hypothetical protein
LVFGKQVARIIAIADNHYPGFMHNKKQMDNALQFAFHLSRTSKITYGGVKDMNYMEQIPRTTEATEGEQEKRDQSPLGTQSDVKDNEQDRKTSGSDPGSNDHGEGVSQANLSPCLNQEGGIDNTEEP